MKKTPEGWPRISVSIFYQDPAKAIDWLCRAFGFEVRMKVEGENGAIVHSELTFGEGLVMVGQAQSGRPGREFCTSPKTLNGANTQMLCLFVDDADAHCAHAREAGAVIAQEPTTQDHGPEYWADRSYRAVDPEGHNWWFMQRVRDKST